MFQNDKIIITNKLAVFLIKSENKRIKSPLQIESYSVFLCTTYLILIQLYLSIMYCTYLYYVHNTPYSMSC